MPEKQPVQRLARLNVGCTFESIIYRGRGSSTGELRGILASDKGRRPLVRGNS